MVSFALVPRVKAICMPGGVRLHVSSRMLRPLLQRALHPKLHKPTPPVPPEFARRRIISSPQGLSASKFCTTFGDMAQSVASLFNCHTSVSDHQVLAT